MKGFKVLLVIMAAALVTFGLSGVSFAHSGGVFYCDECHTMHNAQGTSPMITSSYYKGNNVMFSGNVFLLKGSDQSSTCLNCHGGTSTGSFDVFTESGIVGTAGAIPKEYGPGGDFAWLQVVPAGGATTTGDRRGHNIIGYDYGLTASPTFTGNSPGGSYPSTSFYCSSCHDPHGTYRHTGGNATMSGDIKSSVFNPVSGGINGAIEGSGSYGSSSTDGGAVGVYRLLAGMNYLPASISSNTAATFSYDSPVAVAPSTYNSATWGTAQYVVYGSGMSQWCANCHPKVLESGLMGSGGQKGSDTNLIHPVGPGVVLSEATAGSNTLMYNYVNYAMTGKMPGTAGMSGYSPLVPIEVGDNTTGTNLPSTGTLSSWAGSTTFVSLSAANSTANVMCLSCHRAHASAFQNMTRWDMSTDFLTSGGVFVAGTYQYSTAKTGSQLTAAYYNAPVGTYLANTQRSLCNKCHAKD